jgi:hypothetical protein
LKICPHHELEEWIIIQTFYDRLNDSTHMSIDVVVVSVFTNQSVDDMFNLIEKWRLTKANGPPGVNRPIPRQISMK